MEHSLKHSLSKTRATGYTIIELMIVVSILGVLASIAVPTYWDYVVESRRSDAIANITRLMSQQELFYGNNGSNYAATVAQLGYTGPGNVGNTLQTEDGHYAIQMRNCIGTLIVNANECILLTAQAISQSQLRDEDCRFFTLNSFGARTSINAAGDLSNGCWRN